MPVGGRYRVKQYGLQSAKKSNRIKPDKMYENMRLIAGTNMKARIMQKIVLNVIVLCRFYCTFFFFVILPLRNVEQRC